MLKQLTITCEKYVGENAERAGEMFKVKIFTETLKHLCTLDEWRIFIEGFEKRLV